MLLLILIFIRFTHLITSVAVIISLYQMHINMHLGVYFSFAICVSLLFGLSYACHVK